ncbi:DUF456 domain-containing protein [Williamsia sterculiae]|uniref:DUF456 domain-containing protein n=1 Tax=Williamsia sterculiae TaxID=1344003 RepID=A0A1N7CQH6_9NOCA|nr:DUF456 domain-containing protein [Williamsia sterculiae]SIR65695.1 hypothetical protein SAMN05445060_0285 [Williamsia sterculiae]
MSAGWEVVTGLVIVVGLFGILLPVLPGVSLIAVAIGVWAIVVGGWAWMVFAVAAALLLISGVTKYLLAQSSMSRAGVPTRTVLVAGGLGIVGFFVVPVVGLFLGFVLGAFLAEWVRLRDPRAGWQGARTAIRATGLALLIELVGGLLASASWLAGAVAL